MKNHTKVYGGGLATMDLTWTKPFGPKGDTHITETDILAVVKFE